MAIARVTSGHTNASSGSPINTSLTVSGSNTLLVMSFADTNSQTLTPTFNGVALTQIQGEVSGNKRLQMWYLVNPASGTHTLSVGRTNSADPCSLIAAVYSGVLQTGQPDASASADNQTGATITGTVTTIKDSAWAVFSTQCENGATASTNSTAVENDNLNHNMFDTQTHGGITPAGAFSMSATQTSGLFGWIMASFASLSVEKTFNETITLSETLAANVGIPVAVSDTLSYNDTSKLGYGFNNTPKTDSQWLNQTKN